MTRQEGGRTGARTVLWLIPVTYEISLIYMGNQRVAHGAGVAPVPAYRCRFDLKRGEFNPADRAVPPGLPPLEEIRNIITYPDPEAAGAPGEGEGADAADGAVDDDAGEAGGADAADDGGDDVPEAEAAEGEEAGEAEPADAARNPVSLPLSAGGDNTNPTPDELLRLVILDNHGMRADDADPPPGNDLLLAGGDNHSKPRSYQNRGFVEDIFPIVALRVVVRMFWGPVQIDLKADDLQVLWEIKDPEDEGIPGVRASRAQRFVDSFFNANSRDSDVDGDDNCSTTFGGTHGHPTDGLRVPSTDANPQPQGIKVDDVLFNAPYDDNPPIDTVVPPAPGVAAPAGNPLENVHAHGDLLTPVTAHDTTRGLSELTAVDETVPHPRRPGTTHDIKVGVSDVVYKPYPAGGDNYRFLLTLVTPDPEAAGAPGEGDGADAADGAVDDDAGEAGGAGDDDAADDGGDDAPEAEAAEGEPDEAEPADAAHPLVDVRETVDLNRAVEIRDRQNHVIPHPHCFTTGRIVTWRGVDLRLLILVNGAQTNAIDFGRVRRRYAEAFIELHGPTRVFRLRQAGWQRLMQDYFEHRAGIAGVTPAVATTAAHYANYDAAGATFLPPFVHNPPATFLAGAPLLQRHQTWRITLGVTHIPRIVREIVTDVSTRLRIPAPGQSTRQQDAEGFFVVMGERMVPAAIPGVPGATLEVGGSYVAEQQFYLDRHAGPTHFFIHELGHGLYLRHGLSFRIAPSLYQAAGAASPVDVSLYSMASPLTFPFDHEQGDAVECIMSYDQNTASSDFCAMCVLTLRYYDRVRLAATNHRRFTRGWNPAHIVEVLSTGLLERANAVARTVARGTNFRILTVAAIEPVDNTHGHRSVKLLDTLPGATHASYIVKPAGLGVTVGTPPVASNPLGFLRLVAAGATAFQGRYTIEFRYRGRVRATLLVDVT